MHRGALSDLTTFITVADSLSFRGAGERLGVTPSALSHSMKQLEARLGMRLLNRTTRSVSLTDAGLRLLERLRPAFDQITNAMEDLTIWKCFLSTYPEVNLEVEVGEKPIDIVGKGFDAGIGPRNHSAIDMIAVRVTDPRKIAVVATPSYFAQHSPPQTPDDLLHHGCIQYRVSNGRLFEWMFERNGESTTLAVNGRVIVNSCELALRAAVDGLGLAYVIESEAGPLLRSGQLVRVLEEWSPAVEGLYLYHPSHRQMPAALRALIEMLQAARRTRH